MKLMKRIEILEKLSSLEVWNFGGITRQLSQNFVGLDNYDMYRRNFTCPDLINPLSFPAAKLLNFRNRKAIAFTMADRLSRIYTFGCKLAFTMADWRSSRFHISSCALAFTVAEILISLTIIGIIAAITLPALQANINESAWKAQRKALYSRMSQAISMMPSLNGYGVGATEQETALNAAQAFVSEGLSKVLKITNICDGSVPDGLKKCGFPDEINLFSKINNLTKLSTPKKLTELNSLFNMGQYNQGGNGSAITVSYSQIDTNTAAFETVNGESVLTFYNPNCGYVLGKTTDNKYKDLVQPTMCANFIYDLNGKKGPNKVGKDIGFMTAFYPTDSEFVSPFPVGASSLSGGLNSVGELNAKCRQKYGNGVRNSNIYELESLFVNKALGIRFGTDDYYSNTYSDTNTIYLLRVYCGKIVTRTLPAPGNNFLNYCVK